MIENKNRIPLFLVVILCLFFAIPKAMASNYGYIWFSTGKYLDAVGINNGMDRVPRFLGEFPKVNSIVNIDYDVPIYSFDVIDKISKHYNAIGGRAGCDVGVKGGLTAYMVSSSDNKDCTIQDLKLKEYEDYFMLTQRKNRVLGYVHFKNMNFMLIESIK